MRERPWATGPVFFDIVLQLARLTDAFTAEWYAAGQEDNTDGLRERWYRENKLIVQVSHCHIELSMVNLTFSGLPTQAIADRTPTVLNSPIDLQQTSHDQTNLVHVGGKPTRGKVCGGSQRSSSLVHLTYDLLNMEYRRYGSSFAG